MQRYSFRGITYAQSCSFRRITICQSYSFQINHSAVFTLSGNHILCRFTPLQRIPFCAELLVLGIHKLRKIISSRLRSYSFRRKYHSAQSDLFQLITFCADLLLHGNYILRRYALSEEPHSARNYSFQRITFSAELLLS